MEKIQVLGRQLFGSTVRTNNQNEMTSNGKIGQLWHNFMANLQNSGKMDTVAYGIYFSYESDQYGDYDCSIASENSLSLENETVLTIPAGLYLKFEKSGECPMACIELWQEIWNYFEQSDSPRRRYEVDFEEYVSKTDVAIYIGIYE